MTRNWTVIVTLLGAALAAVSPISLPSARAVSTPPAGPIARVGDRVVDEADVEAAAAAMADHPLRRKNPALWRRMLVDRCVDRELLATEAERKGYGQDPDVQQGIRDREYELLLGEIYRRVLIPGIEPTKHQIDSLRATGLYRGLDLDYILLGPSETGEGRHIVQSLRGGASFDSTARKWSQHPSRANGGHFGWMLARDVDSRIYAELRDAKPSDVFGPFVGSIGSHIFRVRRFQDLAPDSIYRLVKDERTRGLMHDYHAALLEKYHFALDSTQVNAVLFLAATEPVAEILASLGPDGTRPRTPGQYPLGVIARVDGDSLTFRNLVLADRRSWDEGAKLHLQDSDQLAQRCAAALIPALVPRDARDRGIDRDPAVARALRLIREEEATRAMVAHESGGTPDSAAMRAYYEENAARYERPRAMRARAFCFRFDSAAAAEAALRSWLVPGVADSVIAAHGLKSQPRASATTIWPGWYGEITVLDSDSDPVAAAIRGLSPGRLSPVIHSIQGIVIAEPLEREAPRPLSLEEAAPAVRRDAQANRESHWITTVLSGLRAGTKIEVATARLAKLKLEIEGSKKGTH